MTPEEARAPEPGTTPGPWEWKDNTFEGFASRDYDSLGNDTDNALETQDCEDYSSWVIASDEDKALIAAAPDMRATIAAQTWEYGVERSDRGGPPYTVWYESEHAARQATQRPHLVDRDARLVRRPVGPVEVVE